MDEVPYQFRLSWDDLHLFLEVARSGTLTAAAMRLKLSQPTAGRRLRALETTVGRSLFERTSGGFRLTEYGKAMLAHAERMEEGAISLDRHLTGTDRGFEGSIRLACPEWIGRAVLAAPATAFVMAHPFVTIEFATDYGLLPPERSNVDLAFRFQRFQEPEIIQRRLAQVRYGVFAAQAYLECSGPLAPSGEGDGHRLVMMDAPLESVDHGNWMRRRWPRARVSLRSNSRDILAHACLEGAGLAVLPFVVGQQLGLAQVETGELPPAREIWIGHYRDLNRLARMRAFLDYLDQSLAGEI